MTANRIMRQRNTVVLAEQAKRQREALEAEEKRKQLEQAQTVPPSKPDDEPGPEAA